MPQKELMMKIGIIGSGLVGSTAAYAMVMKGIGREIILVDKNEARAQAEADDILHAIPFSHPLRVAAGDYPDLADSRAVIITAGVGQRPGETRLQLLERNVTVFQEVVPQILTHAPAATLVVATNPVDVMTHLTAHYAAELGVPSSRVIGSGTTLDTARFRTLLASHFGVDPHHVHGYVVGEHGDSEVLTWSLVTIGGTTLENFCRLRDICLDEEVKQAIDHKVRRAAYNIIAGKGATYYGIGSALARIVDVILRDQRAILTVCTPMAEMTGVSDVTASLPHLIGGEGILATLPLPLDEAEAAALRVSVQAIREAIDVLDRWC
jgi:L-lactate dehydrogenase